ncbi:MAG: hypothetical protein AAGA54_21860 [Myxococcota bacterium]
MTLFILPACDDAPAEPVEGGGASTGEVDDDDDGAESSTGEVSETTGAAEDCSCFEPLAEGSLPENQGCFEPLEVFLGCEAAAMDCGAFGNDYDVEFEGPPTEGSIEALQCTLDAFAAGARPAFVLFSTDDMYGGKSDYLPLPEGRYGVYGCNTTNETFQSVSTRLDPSAEAAAACVEAWGGAPEAEPYSAAVDCLQAAMVDEEPAALAACE